MPPRHAAPVNRRHLRMVVTPFSANRGGEFDDEKYSDMADATARSIAFLCEIFNRCGCGGPDFRAETPPRAAETASKARMLLNRRGKRI
jgi:hypothetical protein